MLIESDFITDEIKNEYLRIQLEEIVKEGALEKIVRKAKAAVAQTNALIVYSKILEGEYVGGEVREKYAKVQLEEILKDGILESIAGNFRSGATQAQALRIYIMILEGDYIDESIKQGYAKAQFIRVIKKGTLKKIVENFKNSIAQGDGLRLYITILKGEYVDEDIKERFIKVQLEELIKEGTLRKIVENFRGGTAQMIGLGIYIAILDGEYINKEVKENFVKVQLEEIIKEGTLKKIVESYRSGVAQAQGLLIYRLILEGNYIDINIKKQYAKIQLEKIIKEGTLRKVTENIKNGHAQAEGLRTYIMLLKGDHIDRVIKQEYVKVQLEEIITEGTLKKMVENFKAGHAQEQAIRTYLILLDGNYIENNIKENYVRVQLKETVKEGTLKRVVENFRSNEAQATALRAYIMLWEGNYVDVETKVKYIKVQLEEIIEKGTLKKIVMNVRKGLTQAQGLITYTLIMNTPNIKSEIREIGKGEIIEFIENGVLENIYKKIKSEYSKVQALEFYKAVIEYGERWGLKREIIEKAKLQIQKLAKAKSIIETDVNRSLERLIEKDKTEIASSKKSSRSSIRFDSVVIPMPEAWIEGDMGRMKRDIARGTNFVGTNALGGLSFTIGEYGSELILSGGDWSKLSHIKLGDVLKSFGAMTVGSGVGNSALGVAGNTVMLTEAGRKFAVSATGQLFKKAAKKLFPLYCALLALELIREGEVSPPPQQALAIANILIATGSVHGLLYLGKTLYYARKGVTAAKAINLPAITPQTIAIMGVKMAAVSILDFTAIKGLAMAEEKAVMMAVEHNLKIQLADACTYMDKLIKKFEDDPNSVTVGDLLYAKEKVRDSFLMLAQFRNPQVFEAIKLKVAIENGKIDEDEVDEELQKAYESAEYLPESQRYTPFMFPILDVMYRGDLGEIEIPEPAMNTDGTSVFLSALSTVSYGMPDFGETIDGVVEREPRYFMNIYHNVSEDPLGVIQQYEEFMGTRMWVLEQFAGLVTKEVLAATGG